MCDTLVALGNSTADGKVIFGKNSDRLSNEVQLITYLPHIKHDKGQEVECTYITIPQVSETAAIIMSQPWWMFGCEMGCNEYDVVIGNEAVYTKERIKRTGLLGMDLLRLGLERGKTAKEALDIIIDLLEKHGQGGNCAYGAKMKYHNSFIIADPSEAYVLETADDWWIVENVKDVRSISNNISIRGKGDSRKDGIVQHAVEKGYCKDDNDFDFVKAFSSGYPLPDPPPIHTRDGCTLNQLKTNKGEITEEMMMDFLRSHEAGVCMHGDFESTGSQVSLLRKDKKSIHWFTGTTLPCVSTYKPYTFPVESQRVSEPGPYKEMERDWFWKAHAEILQNTSKPKYFEKEVQSIDADTLVKMKELLSIEDTIDEEEFIHKIGVINLEAWDKTIKLI